MSQSLADERRRPATPTNGVGAVTCRNARNCRQVPILADPSGCTCNRAVRSEIDGEPVFGMTAAVTATPGPGSVSGSATRTRWWQRVSRDAGACWSRQPCAPAIGCAIWKTLP